MFYRTEGPYVTINGKQVLNLVRTDFHGFLTNPQVVVTSFFFNFIYLVIVCVKKKRKLLKMRHENMELELVVLANFMELLVHHHF